jgi:AraC-like DNA-binding protein
MSCTQDSTTPFFKISEFCIQKGKEQKETKTCCHYEIYFVVNGKGKHIVDLKEYDIEDFMIFFLSPTQSEHWICQEQVEGVKIEFSESFLMEVSCGILQELTFLDDNFVSIKLDNNQKCEYLLHELLREYNMDKFAKSVSLRSYLILVLIGIQRNINDISLPKTKKNSDEYIWKFKKLIKDNGYKNETVEYYANELNISADYLNKIVKTSYKRTASKYIREQTILEAQRALAYTNDTVEAISIRLGFVDISYFRRFFKRETSKTATEYRSHIREKYPIKL